MQQCNYILLRITKTFYWLSLGFDTPSIKDIEVPWLMSKLLQHSNQSQKTLQHYSTINGRSLVSLADNGEYAALICLQIIFNYICKTGGFTLPVYIMVEECVCPLDLSVYSHILAVHTYNSFMAYTQCNNFKIMLMWQERLWPVMGRYYWKCLCLHVSHSYA